MVNLPHGSDDEGTPVDPPIWQLRPENSETAQTVSSECAAYSSSSSSSAALESHQCSDPAAAALSTSGLVSSRYLASVTPDARVHVFRETTV